LHLLVKELGLLLVWAMCEVKGVAMRVRKGVAMRVVEDAATRG